MSFELKSHLVLHKFDKLVFYAGSLGIGCYNFPFRGMLAQLVVDFLLLGLCPFEIHRKKTVHHHVGITSDRRCEMGVVLKCQSVVSDVFGVISRLCHCPEREQFYGIELRSVLRLSEEVVQFAGYLLAVVCRSECVAEIADEGAEVVKFQLVRFIVHAVNKGLGIFLSAFVAAGSTLAACRHKFRHAAVGQEHKLFNEPVGFFRNLLIDTHRAALFIHLDLHFRAFKADCT